jgi:hypothetical protein
MAKATVDNSPFAPLIGKKITIEFDGIVLNAVLQAVEMQKLTGMTNAPEKRMREEGKYYTPPCIKVVCDVGSMVFVQEDCQIVAIANGIAFMFSDYAVRIRCTN